MSSNRYDGHDLDDIASALAAAAVTRHVYVAPSGNDANDGTSASPKLTLMGAFALCPMMLTAPFVVHLASGDYTWSSEPPRVWQRDASAFMCVIGDGAGQVGDDGMTVVATGSVTATSTAGLIQTTGLTDQALIGCTLEVLTGVSAGQRRGITDNSATTIRLVHPTYTTSYGPLAIGDTFRVVRPAAKVLIAPFRTWNPAGQLMHAINFQTNGLTIEPSCGPMMAYGIETGLINVRPLTHFNLGSSTDTSRLLELFAATAPSASSAKWIGWGWQNPNARGSLALAGPSQFVGFMATLSGVLATVHRNINAYVQGARLARIAGSAGMVVFEYPPETPPLIVASQAQDGIHLEGTMCVDFVNVLDVEISAPSYGYLVRLCHQNQVIFRQAVRVKVKAGVSTCVLIEMHGESKLMNWAGTEATTLSVTIEDAATYLCLFSLFGSSQLDWQGAVVCPQQRTWGSTLTDSVRARFDSLVLSGTVGAAAVRLWGGSRLQLGRYGTNVMYSTLSATFDQSAALIVDTGAELVLHDRSQMTVTNLGTSNNCDGIRCYGKIEAYHTFSASSVGLTGFGLNCRGGGRAIIGSSQPVNIVGPTADMTVGSAAGEDFNDTALAASFAYKQAGASIIQRRA